MLELFNRLEALTWALPDQSDTGALLDDLVDLMLYPDAYHAPQVLSALHEMERDCYACR
jgi:hypothetical protein